MRFRGFLIRRYETFSPLDKADSCECYFTEIIFTESKFSKEVIPFPNATGQFNMIRIFCPLLLDNFIIMLKIVQYSQGRIVFRLICDVELLL